MTFEENLLYLGDNKLLDNSTWQDIADIMNSNFNLNYSNDYYRKHYGRLIASNSDFEYFHDITEENREIIEDIELRKQKVKISDLRNQVSADIRKISREETIKEIALEYANIMNKEKKLEYIPNFIKNTDGSAILLVSDMHYGISVENSFNVYNPSIAVSRLNKLLSETIDKCKDNNISNIYVINLGDLISGRIHLQIRLENREDVISQTMNVAELMAEFLNVLCNNVKNVYYGSVSDNHSRIEPNKKDSLQLESLSRIIDWYLKSRVSRVKFLKNSIGDDILTFSTKEKNFIAVHGDKDKPTSVSKDLSLFTRGNYDAILMAHNHHFDCNFENDTWVIQNGSIMGQDNYSYDLRLFSNPEQTLLIVGDVNSSTFTNIYPIELE